MLKKKRDPQLKLITVTNPNYLRDASVYQCTLYIDGKKCYGEMLQELVDYINNNSF